MADDKHEPLSIWVIYDHPRDYPDHYVARRHIAEGPNGQATDDFMIANRLDVLRTAMRDRGLVRMDRFPQDDPVILETWF